MIKNRVFQIILAAFVVLTAFIWGPIFWMDENLVSDGSPFIRVWSDVAVFLFVPWLIAAIAAVVFLIVKIQNKHVKIGIIILMIPLVLFVIILGPLIHVCSLGVDCV